MPEPTSHATGALVGAGAATITGSLFGVEYLSLMWGFVGGLVATFYLPPFASWWRLAVSVTGSTVLGGVLAPIMAAGAVYFFPWLVSLGITLTIAVAFGIGFFAQKVAPAALNRAAKEVGEAQ